MKDQLSVNAEKKILCLAIAASLALFSAGQAVAQSEQGVLEEIIVTAQKREQALSDVPLSIIALTDQQIENANVTQFRYIENLSPSLSSPQNFAANSTILSARGIIGISGLDATVASYVDDMPFVVPGQAWAPSGNLFDLQRVEVINGPQGTLYGQGAMGATIRMLTNDPDASEFSGAVEVGYADVTDGEANKEAHALINIPIVEDTLAARISYSKQDLGGYLDFIGIVDPATLGPAPVEDGNDSEYEDIRAKLLFTPNEQLSVRLTAFSSETESTLIDFVTFPNPGDARDSEAIYGDDVEGYNSDNQGISLKIEYDFGSMTLVNVLSQLDTDIDIQSNFNFGGGFISTLSDDSESTSNELRLVSNLDGNLQFVVGHYYFDGTTDREVGFGFDIPNVFNQFFGNDVSQLDTEVSSFFGEVYVDLLDGALELIAGVRRFEDDRSFVQRSDLPPVQDNVFVDGANNSDSFSSTNPRFNIAYNISDDWMVYANYATGYRSGNFNAGVSITAATNAGFPGDVTSIDPDEVTSIDLGTKFTVMDGRLSGELVYYQSDWEDSQGSISLPGSPFIATLINVGDVEVSGFEYNLTLRASDALSFNLNGSKVDAEYENLTNGVAANTGLTVGGDVLGVLDRSLTASATYTRPVSIAGQSLELMGYADYLYYGENTDAYGSGVVKPSNKKMNLRLGLSDPDNWEAALYIDNLTDEDDIIAISFVNIGTAPRPRTIGLSLKKYF